MAADKRDCVPIPQPPGYPLVGNITDVDPELPIQSLCNLADEYGEIFSLTTFGKKRIIVTSQALANEVCDEKRFGKNVSAGLAELRHGVGDGLFTAHTAEENWSMAHRVLVPAFGPLNLADMFDDMKDIASQLVLKWARYGTQYKIPATEDFTRLTLDTLALCAMDYRFNSFYTEEQHPFIDAMVNFLRIGGSRARRPGYLAAFYRSEDQIFERDIKYMRDLSKEIVQQRRIQPNESKDLLNAMVKGIDPKTGKGMGDDVIINNMITFLIAGHETTSGLLSFLFYYLLKSPEAMRKAQEEVDTVIGEGSIRLEHINKLSYIQAMLRETLRLQPTAPAFTVGAKAEGGEILGGKYFVEKDTPIAVVLPKLHRDPAVYGEDSEEWKPERMLDEPFSKLPPNSWKAFGNGARGCIGRPFAWQEAVLVTAMALQYFNFELEDPAYNLQIKATLTIKPKDFLMKASLREGWTATKIEQSLSGSIRSEAPTKKKDIPAAGKQDKATSKPFTVLYGSNSGTCESFAQALAADATDHGFKATKVDTLDSAKQNLPSKEPIVIVTASYEGEPTDNAAHFFDWLSNLKDDEKTDVQYVVFGCGHSDWKLTHHKVPKAIDELLSSHGGKKVCESGYADAAGGDMMGAFQEWEDLTFWPAMKMKFGGEDTDDALPASMGQNLDIQVFSKRASHLRADVSEAKVISTHTLTAPGEPEKKHIKLELPSSMTFRAGDYLAVLPLNPAETVRRVLTRFSLPWDAMLSISSRTDTTIPTDHPISAQDLFSAYLELSQPATKRNIAMLASASDADNAKQALQALLDDDALFKAEIQDKRASLLTLLERYPAINLPLAAFVASLIPMRVRQYSISSSPLASPTQLTLTYALLKSPSLSRGPDEEHIGVASSYLATLKAGDIVHVAVKPSHPSFHLPSDPTTPVIMICAGTGIAPFRGFVQERAVQIAAGRKLAPAHLYIGTRHPERDTLYTDELDGNAQERGAVMIHRAFSKAPDQSNGYKHVDDAVRGDADNLIKLWDQGAKVFICGSREVGESVRKACLDIVRVSRERQGLEWDADRAQKWFEGLRNERFSTDVFQ